MHACKKRRGVDTKQSLICSSPESMSLLQQQCIWVDRTKSNDGQFLFRIQLRQRDGRMFSEL